MGFGTAFIHFSYLLLGMGEARSCSSPFDSHNNACSRMPEERFSLRPLFLFQPKEHAHHLLGLIIGFIVGVLNRSVFLLFLRISNEFCLYLFGIV